MFLTMNSISKDLNVYFLIDWKNVFLNLLSMKVTFKAIVYIYNQKHFNNLVITFQEEDFKTTSLWNTNFTRLQNKKFLL
jgi:hypothetical protein